MGKNKKNRVGKSKIYSDSMYDKSASKRESYAREHLNDSDRECARRNGLTKNDWLAKKFVKTFAIKGPDGTIYTSIKKAKLAHDNGGRPLEMVVFQCREIVDGNLCGGAKESAKGTKPSCPKCKVQKMKVVDRDSIEDTNSIAVSFICKYQSLFNNWMPKLQTIIGFISYKYRNQACCLQRIGC